MKIKETEKPLYICDPTRNTKCKKTACYINGGPCDRTTNPKYSRIGSMPVTMKHYEVKEDKNG